MFYFQSARRGAADRGQYREATQSSRELTYLRGFTPQPAVQWFRRNRRIFDIL